MSKGKSRISLTSAMSSLVVMFTSAQAQVIDTSRSEAVSLTIYNQNFALVRDRRDIELKEGINYLRFEDVAARIDPTSVSFRSLTAPNAVVIREQNYQCDLLDPDTILLKSIGKDVRLRRFLANGQISEVSGVLLNAPRSLVMDTNGPSATANHGLVIKTGEGILLNPCGELELNELPEGLVSKPALLWKLACQKGGKHKSEVCYQTSGMSWKCDYTALLNDQDAYVDLMGWVTLDNHSGASFKNTSLKLVAGDPNRIQPDGVTKMLATPFSAMPEAQFQEQAFAEYHLYTLHGDTDICDNEIKQLPLFQAQAVPIKKRFIMEASPSYVWSERPVSEKLKVKVNLEINNVEADHLGITLPMGRIRVYKRDADSSLEFIGEDQINHTPRDEKVKLCIGEVVDLVAEKTQTAFQQVSNHLKKASYVITVRNHKDSSVTVTSIEHALGDWKIISASQPYTKKDSTTFEFPLNIPAHGNATFSYEIETRS